MPTDNHIEIEVIALLDPKSGGVLNEKAFTKSLTKDLTRLIKETEQTLKALSVNPELAVHPKYAGIKNKRAFLSEIRKDSKKFKEEAAKSFGNLNLDQKVSVAIGIEKAKKDFGVQLDRLEKALVTTAISRGKGISKEVQKALNLSVGASLNLKNLPKGDLDRILAQANRSGVANAGTPSAGANPKIAKQILEKANGNIDRVAKKNVSMVREYLRKEQARLIKVMERNESSNKRTSQAVLDQVDKVSKQLAVVNKRHRDIGPQTRATKSPAEKAKDKRAREAEVGAAKKLKEAEAKRTARDKLKDKRTTEATKKKEQQAKEAAAKKEAREKEQAARKEQLLADKRAKQARNDQERFIKDVNKQLQKHLKKPDSFNDKDRRFLATDVKEAQALAKKLYSSEGYDKSSLATRNRGRDLIDALGENLKAVNHQAAISKKSLVTDVAPGSNSDPAKIDDYIKSVDKRLKKWLTSKNLNDQDRRILDKNIRSALTLSRRLQNTAVKEGDSTIAKRLDKVIDGFETGANELRNTIDKNLTSKEKRGISARLSQNLAGSLGKVNLPTKTTPAEANFLRDFNNLLKGESFAKAVGKRFSEMNEKDLRHLRKLKDYIVKAASNNRGYLSGDTASKALQRIELATRGPAAIGGTGNIQSSLELQRNYTAGNLSGVNKYAGAVDAKKILSNLDAESRSLAETRGAYRKLIEAQTTQLNDKNYVDKAHADQLRKSNESLGASIKQMEAREAALSKARGGADKTYGGLKKSIAGSERLLDVGLMLKQFARLYLGFAALGQIVRGITALVGELVTLDTNMKSVQAAALGTTEQMHGIRSAIKSVGITTKFTIGEISEAARILVQADVPLKDIPASLRATANLAAATDSDVGISADLLTSFGKVYTEYSPDQLASLLTKTVNLSKLNAEDLQVILGISTQTAKAVNLSGEQFLSAIAVLRNQGLKASTSATGLRQGLLEIFAPNTKTTKVLKERYSAIGEDRSAAEIRKRFADFRDASSPLIEVISELKRLGFEGSARKEFTRFINVRGGNAVGALARGLPDLVKKEYEVGFGDSATRASEIQLQSLSATIKNLGAAITTLSDSAFAPLLDAVKNLSRGLTETLMELNVANSEAIAQGKSGLGSVVNTGIIGGMAGAIATRGRGIGASAVGITTGTAVGAYAGSETLDSDKDVASLNLALAGALAAWEAYSAVAKHRAARVAKSNLTLQEFAAMQSKKDKKFTGKIGTAISGTKKAFGSLLKVGASFLGPLGTIAFLIGPSLIDFFSGPDLKEQLIAMNEAVILSKERVEKARRSAEQFTSTTGATAGAVFEGHSLALQEFSDKMELAGVAVAKRSELVSLVNDVIDEGLDAKGVGYSKLSAFLRSTPGFDDTQVGDYIREFHNLQQASNESLTASIEGTRLIISGIKDKLDNGQKLQETEVEMLKAWDEMIYSSQGNYALLMGNISDLSADAVVNASVTLGNLQKKFDARLRDVVARIESTEQERIDKIAKEQVLAIDSQKRYAIGDVSNADTPKELKSATDKVLRAFQEKLKALDLSKSVKTTDAAIEKANSAKEQALQDTIKELKSASRAINNKGTFFGLFGGDELKGEKTEKLTSLVSKLEAATKVSINKDIIDIGQTLKKQNKAAKAVLDTATETKKVLEKVSTTEGSGIKKELNDIIDTFAPKKKEIANYLIENGAEATRDKYLVSQEGALVSDPAIVENRKILAAVKASFQEIEGKYSSYLKEVAKSTAGSVFKSQGAYTDTKEKLAIAKGTTKKNLALAESNRNAAKVLAKEALKKAKDTLDATPGIGELSYNAEEYSKAQKAVAKATQRLATGIDNEYKANVTRLKRGSGRAKRPSKAEDLKDKQAAALEAFKKKEAEERLKTLKKSLSNLKYDKEGTDSDLASVKNKRAALIAKINEQELIKANKSVTASEKYLDAQHKATAQKTRETQAKARLAEATKKNELAYNKAVEDAKKVREELDNKRIVRALKEIDNAHVQKTDPLVASNGKETAAQNLKTSAEKVSAQSALLKTISKSSDKYADVQGAIKSSTQGMIGLLQTFIGGTTFGKQLELMDSLIMLQETSPMYDAVMRLPNMLANAVIAPFYDQNEDDDRSMFVKIRESVKAGFLQESQTIATDYATQAFAGITQSLLPDFMKTDEAKARQLQKDMVLGLAGNVEALKRLTSVVSAVATGGDVNAALNKSYNTGTGDTSKIGDFKVPQSPREWYDLIKDSTFGSDGTPNVDAQGNPVEGEGGVFSTIMTEGKEAFSALFQKDGDLFTRIGDAWSELFGKDSTIGSTLSDLFSGLFSGEGGKEGGSLISKGVSWLTSWLGGSGAGGVPGFNKGVAGYGKIEGAKGRDKIAAFGMSDGKVSPIFVGEGESILSKSASQALGYNNINDWNNGNIAPSIPVDSGSSVKMNPNVNVEVAPPITQVLIGDRDIEKAMNTQSGRKAIANIAKEAK